MEWTEREIAIAKSLQEPDVKGFLTKIFTELKTQNGEVLEKNIVTLDDAEYGRLMKAHYLSKSENKAKFDLIAKISKFNTGDKASSAIAPR